MIAAILAGAIASSALGVYPGVPDYDGWGGPGDWDSRFPGGAAWPIWSQPPAPPVPKPVAAPRGESDGVLRSNEPRMLRRLDGHTSPVRSAVFSPDGKTVLTASWDGTARLWDAAKGAEILNIPMPQIGDTGLQTAAFSPDGTKVVTAGADKTARIWETSTGKLLATLSGHTAQIDAAAFSADGRRLVTGARDGTARVWDTASGDNVRTLNLGGHVSAVALDVDGARVLTANSEGVARLWDFHTASATHFAVSAPSYSRKVGWIGFTEGGKSVAVAGRSLQVFDASSGAPLRALGDGTRPEAVSVSADGRKLLAIDSFGKVRVFDTATGALTLELSTGSSIYGVGLSPDGSRFVVARSTFAEVWRIDYLPEEREAIRKALNEQVSTPAPSNDPGSAQNRFRRNFGGR